MQWIIDKKDDSRGGLGVSTSYDGMKALCGVALGGWCSTKLDRPDMNFATAIAYSTKMANQYKVGLN